MPGMDAPSMVQRSGDTLIIRSVVSGDQLYLDQSTGSLVKTSTPMIENYRLSAINLERGSDHTDEVDAQIDPKDEGLPQCKIKRNYSCNSCTFFTQNPRYFLTHLREIHGEKIVINECKLCLYASRHYQKLVRHMKMVHGSTEGIEEHGHARKRQLGREGRKRRTESPARLNSPVPQQLQQEQIISIAKPPIEESVVVAADEPLQNRLIKCSVCEFTTLYKDQLVDHEQDEHYKTKFFRCEKCSYVTHIKARYSKHVKYHSMPMIKCVTCDFRTPYKWNLDRHMKNHGGTGPFKCAACDFTADIKQSLTVHEMNHHVPPVGHAAGMGMARRRNKVGGTDINEDFISDNGDLSDSYNNNNNNDDFEEPPDKRCKLDPEDQPTDLSQKSNPDGAMAQKRVSRPVPNLIPIQAAQNALNLSKSFSVKDIASLFLNEEKLNENSNHLQKINPLELSPNFNSSGSKKKNANIFDRLKEHLSTEVGRNENLKCSCGYLSKCLSESIIHQKSCNQADLDEKHSSPSPINLSANTGSTRCQYCRHRCKSSADLSIHLQNCSEAANYHDSLDSMSDNNGRQESVQEENMDDQSSEMAGDSHPMENKVFVWNRTHDMASNEHMDQDDEDKATGSGSKSESSQIGDKMQAKNENSYYGVETAPGYGEVTKKMTPEEEAANSSLKKVYKCPHCSFWASTASRFHVHIVGHLNKKPFECSLCAYRSNWRWDITKHIRLKTIRDPSHKNARVLMNDETGRRNYTKYNKYITLMKVTDEDGDPKLMKSGEMTPDQEASLSFLNEYTTIQKLKPKEENKISGNGNGNYQSSSSMDAPHLLPIPLLAEAMLGVIPSAQDQNQSNSISPTLKSSEDLVTQNIDVKIDSTEKRTLYKCRKCNYKNSSREMVLVHVKGHYEEAGINLTQKRTNDATASLQNAVNLNSNAYMKNMLAAMCLPKNQQNSLNPATAFHPVSILPIQSQMINSKHLNSPIQHSPLGLNNVVLPQILGNATAPPNEHGETDERHCRLKHNGDIRIETINRNSDKNAPVYHPLVSQPGGSAGTGGGTTNSNSTSVPSNNSNLNQQNTAQFNPKNTKNLDDFENSKKSMLENSTGYTPQTILQKQLTMAAQSSNLKSKKRQCPSCPFVSESKSQMTYHSSLHKIKPDIHQCHLCSFVSAKKHLLNQHVRAYHEKLENNENVLKAEFEAMDLRSKDSNDVLEAVCKTISFCAFCPARFIGHKDLKLHIKMHSALFPYRCKVCSYTARQEPYLLSHAVVHTNSYHEKSIDQCKKFRQDPEFLSPKLTQIKLNDGEKVWIVSKNVPQTDLDDAIEKNIIQVEHDSQQAINEGDSSKNCSSTIELAKNSGISLLKQQLEAGEKAPNTDRTLVIGKSFDKCPQCPFETYNPINFKNHLSHHRSISGQENAYKCKHCDFSAASENVLKEHERIHFSLIINGFKPVAYTSFNQLKLTLTDDNTTDGSDSIKLLYEDSDGDKESTHHPDDDVKSNESGNNANNDQKCKTIIDIGSGEVIGQCTNS